MKNIELVVLQVDKKINEICDLINKCGGVDISTEEEIFSITSFGINANYFEFAPLPNYRPVARVRVLPGQIWVENKCNLSPYIMDELKGNNINYKLSKKTKMSLDDFTKKDSKPLDIKSIGIDFEYTVNKGR